MEEPLGLCNGDNIRVFFYFLGFCGLRACGLPTRAKLGFLGACMEGKVGYGANA